MACQRQSLVLLCSCLSGAADAIPMELATNYPVSASSFSPWLLYSLLVLISATLLVLGLSQRRRRQLCQQQLELLSRRNQQLLDALPQAALLLDAHFCVQAYNAGLSQVWPDLPVQTGCSMLELISRWLEQPVLDATEQSHLFASLRRADSHLLELRLNDGRLLLLEQRCLADGMFLRLVTDVTLGRQKERRLRQVWHASISGCALLINNELIDANRSFLQMMGVRELAELLGCSLAQLGQPEGGSVNERLESFFSQLAQDSVVIQDWLLHRRDKAYQPVELQVSCIELEHQPAILLVAVDLRTRKQNEQVLLESRRQAEQAASSKSVFLATMSHEIRTPMTGVLGMLEVLEHSRLDNEQRQSLRTIQDSAQALLQIINDVLDFSRIEAGKLVLEATPTSIVSIMESVMSILAGQAQQKSLGFHLFIDPRIALQVLVDGGRLRQIVFNLLTNALKFTERGAIRLEARLLREENSVQFIEFQVIDTGIGISEEQQSRLFQPFMQAEASTSRRFGGTGLGLSICKSLAELMSADISLRSKLQIGTTLSLRIPLPIVTPHVTPYLNLAGLPVLLSVDQERHASLVQAWLEFCGAKVLVVAPAPGDETAQLNFLRQQLQQDGFSLAVVSNRYRSEPDYYSNLNRMAGAGQRLFLLLGRSDGRSLDNEHLLYCSTQPLLPSELLEMLALALGQGSGSDNISPQQPLVVPSIEQACQQGQLILVAEDHPTNQRVILRQLNLLGYAAEIVDNGQEALQAWQSGRYSLVLTDCNMPVMDGYSLSRAIRSREGAGERIPILALTANALSWDSAKCLGAGMDDYLSKPVSLKSLGEKLQHWLPRLAAVSQVEVLDIPELRLEEPIAMAGLRQLFSDEADIREMLHEFVESTQNDINSCAEALRHNDSEQVARVMHKIKGASRIVGASALAESCRLFELAVCERDWPQLQQDWLRFEQQWQKLLLWVKKI